MAKIGILGSGEQFCYDLARAINRAGGEAEMCKISPARMLHTAPYRVIIDRWSFLVKYFRTYLKTLTLSGTYIINNPFMDSADDKFFEYSLATRLGVKVPRTVCLPSHAQPKELGPEVAEIVAPIDWETVANYVGFPAVMKPYDGWAWQEVHKVSSIQEVLDIYNRSGDKVFVLQEYIRYDHYVRSFVIGRRYTLPIKYDPSTRRYIWDPKHLSTETGREIVDACIQLNRTLNYDFNTVEFAIRDGIPYAIDFWNTVPEVDPKAMPEEYYQWVVTTLAKVALEYAKGDLKMSFFHLPEQEAILDPWP